LTFAALMIGDQARDLALDQREKRLRAAIGLFGNIAAENAEALSRGLVIERLVERSLLAKLTPAGRVARTDFACCAVKRVHTSFYDAVGAVRALQSVPALSALEREGRSAPHWRVAWARPVSAWPDWRATECDPYDPEALHGAQALRDWTGYRLLFGASSLKRIRASAQATMRLVHGRSARSEGAASVALMHWPRGIELS
jgi:hypothetical protein